MRDTFEYFTSGFWPFVVFCVIMGVICHCVDRFCDTWKQRK